MSELGNEALGDLVGGPGDIERLAGERLVAAVHERWSVKTGADADAAAIDIAVPTRNSIAALRAVPAPAVLPADGRSKENNVERTAWEVDATLVGYKLEQDRDYHLVLADADGKTMIAEIPDPAAVAAGCRFVPQITAARSAFDARFGTQMSALAAATVANAVPMIVGTRVPVQVVGIGFFDFIHGQTGVAPNGVELHPVLSIAFT